MGALAEIQLLISQPKHMLCVRTVGSAGTKLSGRVLDSRPRGSGFESHWCHCVVSLTKTHKS